MHSTEAGGASNSGGDDGENIVAMNRSTVNESASTAGSLKNEYKCKVCIDKGDNVYDYDNNFVVKNESDLKNKIDYGYEGVVGVVGFDASGKGVGNWIITNGFSLLEKSKIRYTNLSDNNIDSLKGIGYDKEKVLEKNKKQKNQKKDGEKDASQVDGDGIENATKSIDPRNLFAKNMRILNVAYNKLINAKGISNMDVLHTLILSNNEITDFPKVGNLSSMIVVNLSSNRIGNIDK